MHYVLLRARYLSKPQLKSVQKLGKKHSVGSAGRAVIYEVDFGFNLH